MQALVSGDSDAKQETLVVSWESLEKRKAEFDELVNKKIPENMQEISIAREHGDLRENFEFKAAKEMQRVLGRRRAETERDLSLARGTDFANPDTTTVSIGTIVTLKEMPGGRHRRLHHPRRVGRRSRKRASSATKARSPRRSSATRSASKSTCPPSTATASRRS